MEPGVDDGNNGDADEDNGDADEDKDLINTKEKLEEALGLKPGHNINTNIHTSRGQKKGWSMRVKKKIDKIDGFESWTVKEKVDAGFKAFLEGINT